MKKFQIIDNSNNIISKHKTLDLANARLRKIDSVKCSLYASDVDWLTGKEEALQGYNNKVVAVNN